MKNTSEHQKGIYAIILLAFVFASMGLFARFLSTSFTTHQQVYLRLAAAFVLASIAFKKNIDWKKFTRVSQKDWGIIILRAVAYSIFGIVLFTQAINLTKYSNVSFIGSLPFTAILGFILLGEVFTFKKALWITVAFLGVLLISVKDFTNIFLWGRGETIMLISTLFFSLSYVARKWQSDFLNNQELTVINFVFASLAVFLVSMFNGESLPLTGWTSQIIIAVWGAGLFNVFNMYLTNYGFQKVEAVLASNLLTLESLFAVVLGFLFFRETPTLLELIGGLVITVGVIGMNNLEKKS